MSAQNLYRLGCFRPISWVDYGERAYYSRCTRLGVTMSDYLFARPSLLEGIARNIDLFGTLNEYNTSSSSIEADLQAHYNDLACLQKDMSYAIHEVIGGYKSKKKNVGKKNLFTMPNNPLSNHKSNGCQLPPPSHELFRYETRCSGLGAAYVELYSLVQRWSLRMLQL